jgi:protein-histidine N-methyltransferase
MSREDREDGEDTVLEFLDAPSDLVPGVYEGGLKTWECSLDLVNYLDEIKDTEQRKLEGKRILEVGPFTSTPVGFEF